jgi:hypothetical protein
MLLTISRGCAHLCRLADVAHSVETRRSSVSMSPGRTGSKSTAGESVINEKILTLVTTLSDRVKLLESKLDTTVHQRKRSAPDSPPEVVEGHESSKLERPPKQARHLLSEPPGQASNSHERENTIENDLSAGQNGSDAEAEDAATVLEFLAWGRLKDSNLTSGIRDSSTVHDPPLYPEKDMLQSTQAWASSPTSIPGGSASLETFQISQIQEMLPTKNQVFLLSSYHAEWLLFMHCGFHAPSFTLELNQFYDEDEGVITMTSTSLQWTALLFAIICGSMTCAKRSQVSKWGFREG